MILHNCLIMYIFLLSWMLFGFNKMLFRKLVLLSFLCFLTALKMGLVEWMIFISITFYGKITIQDALVHLKC